MQFKLSRMSRLVLFGAVGIAAALLPFSAKASTIVYFNGRPAIVQEIDGLTVGSTIYNVTFADLVHDYTFFGDPTGAQAAAVAIVAALNNSTASYVYSSGGYSTNFTVLTDGSSSGFIGLDFGESGNWQSFGPAYVYTTAQFTSVTPEPASVWLLGGGLLMMLGMAWRRRDRNTLSTRIVS